MTTTPIRFCSWCPTPASTEVPVSTGMWPACTHHADQMLRIEASIQESQQALADIDAEIQADKDAARAKVSRAFARTLRLYGEGRMTYADALESLLKAIE